MSVPATEPKPATPVTQPAVEPEAPTTPPEGAEPKTFDADYVATLRAEAAKHRTAAKANADAAAELAAIKEANKTEAQKLADELAAARKEASDAKREAFAATKGVPVSLVTGSTPDEWEAAVTEALAWRGEVAKPLPAAPSSAGQGNVGEPVGAGVKQLTRSDLANMTPAQIEAARAAGELVDLMAGKTT